MIPLNNINDENKIKDMKPENKKFSVEEIIEIVFEKFSKGLRIIGPLFAFALIVFVGIVAHSFFNINVPYYKTNTNNFFSLILKLIASFLLFSVLFNYFLAVLVKPGSLADIKKSKFYKKKNPYEIDENIIDLKKIFNNKENQCSKSKTEITLTYKKSNNNINDKNQSELDIINIQDNYDVNNDNNGDAFNQKLDAIEINEIENSKEFDELDKYYNNIDNINSIPLNNYNNDIQLINCKYCLDTKPVRSHHCSICNCCVLKMDHHCPWINNCIGQNNHRYFVLFLTHTMFGCFLVGTTSIPILFDNNYRKTTEFNFVSTLSIIGFIMLVFFSAWNWFLVFKGNTTIEYWSIRSGLFNEKNGIKNFALPDKNDNLYLVFGTRSILKAIFIPSIKKLPISGLEWTKLALPNYSFVGLDNISDIKITIDEAAKIYN